MIAALLFLSVAGAAPGSVTIVTPGGERRIPITAEPDAGPLIPAGATLTALGATSTSDGIWAEIRVGAVPFRFLLGARLYRVSDQLFSLASMATVRRDTLFLPLQFLSDALPRHLGTRFRWEPRTARLVDTGAPQALAAAPTARPAVEARGGSGSGTRENGSLKRIHRVTIDPGHGGVDPGNPGIYFPRGINEKHVTLQVGLLVRDELRRRGVAVTMTRTRDTLIDIRHRSRYCAEDCELFVSLHVNSLARRPGYTSVRGFETYILGEARTEDAARVARMENEAIRFEQPTREEAASGLDFILKDLQLNEYLREAARAAELVQEHLDRIHSGPNKGVKHGNFMVLNTARRPAILIEMGFSTNRADARLMSESASQQRLARSIADAIMRYLEEFERKTDAAAAVGLGTRGRE